MPADIAVGLKEVLAAEVAELVKREAARLDRATNNLLNVRRGAWIIASVSSLLILLSSFLTTAGAGSGFDAIGLTLIAIFVIALLSSITALTAGRKLKKQGTLRQGVESRAKPPPQ